MIYCIWYPSGGFGHFVNATISLFGDNFERPNNWAIFSDTGDLHSIDLVLPKYFHNCPYPKIVTKPDKNYCVLIDNGINDESKIFRNVFPNSETIKICYDDLTWPIVAQTLIVKAMRSDLTTELSLDQNWNTYDKWALREKFFLYLKDHDLRHSWRPDPGCHNLHLKLLLNYKALHDFFKTASVKCKNFQTFYNSMMIHNQQYFHSVRWADKIIQALEANHHIDISHITQIWDQAVINYFIYTKYKIEIPANDYADWVQHTSEIKDLL